MNATRVLLALALALAFVPAERRASACCLGCPCTKYKRQEKIVEVPAIGYTHSIRGAVPSWSVTRIARFLMSGYWKPFPVKGAASAPVALSTGDGVDVLQAPEIKFVAADKIAAASTVPGNPVLIRRIEKHGSAILVEVNERTWKLAACPKKPGFACLVDPGKLALDPLPPAGGGTGSAVTP